MLLIKFIKILCSSGAEDKAQSRKIFLGNADENKEIFHTKKKKRGKRNATTKLHISALRLRWAANGEAVELFE